MKCRNCQLYVYPRNYTCHHCGMSTGRSKPDTSTWRVVAPKPLRRFIENPNSEWGRELTKIFNRDD